MRLKRVVSFPPIGSSPKRNVRSLSTGIPKTHRNHTFFKDLTVFYRRVPLANNTNTLLIDESPLKSLLNDQYNVVFPPIFRDNDGQADDFLVCRLLPYLDRLRLSRFEVPEFCGVGSSSCRESTIVYWEARHFLAISIVI